MDYLKSIGRGLRLVNANWQLVLIHAVMFIINIAGFLLFIGLPLIAGIMALGLDAARLEDLESFFMNIENPLAFISEYIGLFFVILLGIFAYVTFLFVIWVYVLGGSAGVLGKAIKDPSSRFSMKTFFSEGNRLFFPLIGYLTVVGLIFIGIFIMLGLVSFIVIVLSEALGQGNTFIGFYFKVLFILGVILLTLLALFLVCVLGAIGFASLVLEDKRIMASFDRAFNHLKKHPGCLWFLGMLVVGYGGVQLVVGVIGYGIQLTDVMLISLPYQIIANVFQGYLSLVVLATVLSHYYFATFDYSTRGADISPSSVSPPPPSPEGSDYHR